MALKATSVIDCALDRELGKRREDKPLTKVREWASKQIDPNSGRAHYADPSAKVSFAGFKFSFYLRYRELLMLMPAYFRIQNLFSQIGWLKSWHGTSTGFRPR